MSFVDVLFLFVSINTRKRVSAAIVFIVKLTEPETSRKVLNSYLYQQRFHINIRASIHEYIYIYISHLVFLLPCFLLMTLTFCKILNYYYTILPLISLAKAFMLSSFLSSPLTTLVPYVHKLYHNIQIDILWLVIHP